MTNNWTDIGNATLVVSMGANPAENHPACMAHINNARKGPHTWLDPAGNSRTTSKRAAKLIVIDPRFTRTASQADVYVRIRPGTDIAFLNGMIRYIIADGTMSGTTLANWGNYMNESSSRSFLNDGSLAGTVSVAGAGKYTDARFKIQSDDSDYVRSTKYSGVGRVSSFPERAGDFGAAGTVFSRMKAHVEPYDLATVADICGCTQAQITEVAQAFIDNCRFAQDSGSGTAAWTPATLTEAKSLAPWAQLSSVSIAGYVEGTGYTVDYVNGTVTNKAIPVSTAVTIAFTGLSNDPTNVGFRATTMLYAMGQTQHTYGSQNIKGFANLQTLLGNMGRAGGGINALRGIHNVQGSTDMGLLYAYIPGYSGPPKAGQTFADYVNKLYGAKRPFIQNTVAWLTTALTGNNNDLVFTATAAGTGGNSTTIKYTDPGMETATESVAVVGTAIDVTLRNVSGILSTAAQVKIAIDGTPLAAALVTVANAPGNDGSGSVIAMAATNLAGGVASSETSAYTFGNLGLQAAGFYNMHKAWFMPSTGMTIDQTNITGTFLLWPRENGDDHITMFRKMGLGTITAAVIWGQNPAVTEPNQSAIRAGLENLDTMVVVENYATETAMCNRKSAGVTYLIPSCSYVEEAGSVTNSGRTLQWRERATSPKGNSKADIELLLRFAKALNGANAFKHISDKWAALGVTGDPWTDMYQARYCGGWTGGSGFETTAALTGETWSGTATAPTSGVSLKGSEAVAEAVFREYAGVQAQGGTVWLYLEGYEPRTSATVAWSPTALAPTLAITKNPTTVDSVTGSPNPDGLWSYDGVTGKITATGAMLGGGPYTVVYSSNRLWQDTRGGGWQTFNRAKSRNNTDADTFLGGHRMFKNWGYTWLVNRRVLYNNGDCPWDQADGYQGPDQVSRFYVSTNSGLIDYSTNYRTIHLMKDIPDSVADADSPHLAPGHFPAHTEPYETVRQDLVLGTGDKKMWGRNTSGGTKWNLVKGDTLLYSPDDTGGVRTGTVPLEITAAATAKSLPEIETPLVLTTIRCVEHFQGGPITRNNSWNVEAEPVPWVEINSMDARTRGISDGDFVNVVTVRGNSTTTQMSATLMGSPSVYTRTASPTDNFGLGFKARVGVGLQSNQRVGQGVVAIPWHWGDQGLSTGSRANDLCIDSWDANTVIPEYKACVCWITKV